MPVDNNGLSWDNFAVTGHGVVYSRFVNHLRRIGPLPILAAALIAMLAALLASGRLPPGAGPDPADPGTHRAEYPAEANVDQSSHVPPLEAQLTYTIAPGDTLSAVAARFGTTVEDLLADNGIRNPDAISVGQEIRLHVVPEREGPAFRTIPDSELVYGPAYLDFDTPAFIASRPGYLRQYAELVNGQEMSGPEIVDRVARDFSVGPRVLLAFVEAESGWATGTPADAAALDYPAGLVDPIRSGLWWQLNWLADRLNGGYYDWKTRNNRVLRLADGTALAGHPSLGPGSFAVQRALAHRSTEAQLAEGLAAFSAAYQSLFGDPWARARPPPDLSRLELPAMRLPWAEGEIWWLTGGPHGGWANGSAWAALDFVPEEDARGCFVSDRWATAVADGIVIDAGPGQIWLDLDFDARRETGPAVLYLHLSSTDLVTDGTSVRAGDPLGHPSCEGGESDATHLHLARTYDGEWLAGGGAVPFVLDGWRAVGSSAPYDGQLLHDDGRERAACECRLVDFNDIAP